MKPSEFRVTIDDLGMLPEIEQSATELAAIGVPLHCSWVTNYLAPTARYRATANLHSGLHFNVLEGRSGLRPSGLTDRDGRFHRRWADFVWAGRRTRLEVEAELEFQLARFDEWLGPPGHLDSHLHLHAIPWLYELLHRRAAERGCGFVRNPYQPVSDRPALDPRLWTVTALRLFAAPRGVPAFGVTETFAMSAERSLATLRRGGPRELIWHPSRRPALLRESDFRWTDRAQMERRAREHDELARFLALVAPRL